VSKIAPDFTYEGIDAPVEFRRHASARRLTLRVSRTRRAVIVTMPLQCELNDAEAFFISNIDWLREHLDRVPHRVPFQEGALMPLRGKIHRLVFAGEHQTAGVVQRAAHIDDVGGSGVEGNQGVTELCVGGHVDHAPQRLCDWLFEEARRDLEVRVIHHADKLGITAPPFKVRDQSSRWGSCSTTGALSFSWRLILAPPFVLDYVVAHEVAHLVEMNHGPQFWALLESLMPRMQEAQLWTERYSLDLHRYGPAERKSSYAQPRRLRRAGH